ncbi:MAG: DNA polymerase III subunit gamma/tau [Ignavibacteriales bacterium]|nr:DNA polymerase III subunit gamma/tau [Ignavibacteriales bacterium]
MSYQVTARKWRPMIFDDVVGQSHVTNTLRNAIASHRVAHAYIFSGTRGCGKTTTARILARSLNCLSPVHQNPDNTCEVCKEIIDGRGLDVIEIDGASNRGVEEIRNLRDSVRYTPTRGTYKIYIIDEVHMLTKEAFNALLKTLEEPPPHVVFIFATTEVHKVPMTILSRCQRFDFRRIATEEIVTTLTTIAHAENITIENDALMVIAKRADGSLRDAQSIFDQVRSFCGSEIKTAELLKAFNVVDQEIYFRVSDFLKSHNTQSAIQLVDEVIKSGYDLREFVGGLTEHLRNLLIVRSTESTQLIEVSENYKKRYEKEASQFTEQDILRYIKQTNELDQALRWAAQPRYRLEAGLIQMAKMENSVQIGELLQQIELLKKKISSSSSINVAPSSPDSMRYSTPPSSDLRVVGEVGAGYLKSKSAISYSSLIGTDLTKLTEVSKPLEVQHSIQRVAEPPAIIQSASADEITEQWSTFVSNVSKSHIAVGTSLTETSILDVHNGMVRISCPDDYHVSTLKRNRDFLANVLHQVIGKQVAIEPVLRSDATIPVKAIYTTPTVSGDIKNLDAGAMQKSPHINEHPMLTLLKRELGAERIE